MHFLTDSFFSLLVFEYSVIVAYIINVTWKSQREVSRVFLKIPLKVQRYTKPAPHRKITHSELLRQHPSSLIDPLMLGGVGVGVKLTILESC